jgi:hypothetical protein
MHQVGYLPGINFTVKAKKIYFQDILLFMADLLFELSKSFSKLK